MHQDLTSRSAAAAFRGLLICLGLAVSAKAVSAPHTPKDDGEVLERLRSLGAADPEAGQLRKWQAELVREPHQPELAVRVARLYLKKNREDCDPRYLGYAQAALAPWWELEQPPVDVLLLRATIRQSRHDFLGAKADLSRLLQVDPRNGQAWLTLATILQVRGEYEAAQQASLHLLRLADELVAVSSLSITTSLHGQAARSYALLRRTCETNPQAPAEERCWAWTALAEMAARLGQTEEAEAHFHKALAIRRDAYLLGAYADFLLDANKAAEAVALLKEETRNDNLLLRLALAEQRCSPRSGAFKQHVAWLQERFAASRRRGDGVHQREEARFSLHLLNQPRAALDLAKANWQVQREPADARILLEAAVAAKDASAGRTVVEWLETNRLEDVQLAKLKQLLGDRSMADARR
jgi:Tfp pilus assembly protein PilF